MWTRPQSSRRLFRPPLFVLRHCYPIDSRAGLPLWSSKRSKQSALVNVVQQGRELSLAACLAAAFTRSRFGGKPTLPGAAPDGREGAHCRGAGSLFQGVSTRSVDDGAGDGMTGSPRARSAVCVSRSTTRRTRSSPVRSRATGRICVKVRQNPRRMYRLRSVHLRNEPKRGRFTPCRTTMTP